MPERDAVASTAIIMALGQHGRLDEAAMAFDRAGARDIRTWNSLLQAYAGNRDLEDAERVVDKMPGWDEVTWTTMCTAYAQAGNIHTAKRIFDCMPSRGMVSWNAMATAFAQQGHRKECQDLFDRMPQHTTLTWNSMIAAAIRDDRCQDARFLFESCPQRNIASWSQMIQAGEKFAGAKPVFDLMPIWDTMSSTAIVSALARDPERTRHEITEAFDSLVPDRSSWSWISLLEAIAQRGELHLAIQCYLRMPCWDATSSNITLTAYGNLSALDSAREIFHAIQHKNVISWTAMASAHAREGDLATAEVFFDRMPHRNIVAYTLMISALAHGNRLHDARSLFDQMPERSAISWNAMIAAYAQRGYLLAAQSLLQDRPVEDSASRNTMIAAYAQHGSLDTAIALFHSMDQRDTISWNTMIAAFTSSGDPCRALGLLRGMAIEGVTPNEATVLAALDACAQISSLAIAKTIHSSIQGTGLDSLPAVLASLISAYGRCGGIAQALELSQKISPDPVAWSCALDARSRSGAALDPAALHSLAVEGLSLDPIVFSLLLLSCSHTGDLHRGFHCWKLITGDFGVVPREDQWACAVDILARCGRLDEARELLLAMPFVPGDAARTALLGAWARS
ncbi:pentatricopeptide repeat-containing protein At4g02750 [Selaginella moellendorffii]|nr:pentatricopeptide repeat-containing protein At4g02750 [Selaginella moellendorffii]|eukprot:XP_002963722.2 pentatricopeptide repeat-containing protein At4g02750 [Selaginella moellendorffii]